MTDHRIKEIVILGGGTAGWMSAAYLGKALQGTATITVLEAPAIPRIGVGEASVPLLQSAFFDYLGVSEEEWMRECNASFKMAVKYVNWRTDGEGEAGPRPFENGTDHFYHPFGAIPNHDQVPLSHYWFQRKHEGQDVKAFDYACFREPPMMDANKAPRMLDGRRAARYAWHFDAHLVADFLRRYSTTRHGVRHVQDTLEEVVLGEDGSISALRTEGGRELKGDFFVDCSGFRSLLINKALEEPFIDMSDHLLCDSAVATAVPHDDEAGGVEPYTSAIAMKAGWTWKIPLLGRFGTGYVYSSQFAGKDEAAQDFCKLWNLDPDTTALNQIRFRVGRNRRAWVRNCVGIGLSSCFLEPLESTGIHFIYGALYHLVKHFPDKRFDPVLIDRFNHEIEVMFDDTRDFIQAHFLLSPRTDTEFWKANKSLKLTEDLSEKIAMHRTGLAVNQAYSSGGAYSGDPGAEFRNFWTNSNFFSIFAGMNFLPRHPLPLLSNKPDSVASSSRLFEEVERQQQQRLSTLPSNYEYLLHLHGKESFHSGLDGVSAG